MSAIKEVDGSRYQDQHLRRLDQTGTFLFIGFTILSEGEKTNQNPQNLTVVLMKP